ncbi:putative bifunctional epoxide hydrolase 2-like [Capsicum annuum]|nr:putative bifunctional epoxide hydrolase 2-like [Capsicum annuum]
MINAITHGTSACSIHVMIEFLLIILSDVPKVVILHDKLFVLMARVEVLTKEVFVLLLNLEESTKNEENMKDTSGASLKLLENIEILKKDLKNVFLKAPADSSQLCFPTSDGPLFVTFLLRSLKDFLNSNSSTVSLIKEEIRWVKEDLELVRSFFRKVEKELNRALWASVLDMAYEVEHAINSIIVRDNGSEEEKEWIFRKLTSGPADINIISIVGMPGIGKTTLDDRVYNDKSIVGHFDIRAWCTVDQEHNEKNLFKKIFNQVIGSKERFNEDGIDDNVADNLWKQLFGKRYLIVLDDLWDTATWDELTKPFPSEFQKESRVILKS